MKKLISTISAAFIALLACPEHWLGGAVAVSAEHNLSDLLDAIAEVESGGDPNAYNEAENAAGLYQIRPIYVKDCNRLCGYNEFSLADRYNPDRARMMVAVYLKHYGNGKGLEAMARIHNGGPTGHTKEATKAYWQKIKAVMEGDKNEN